MATKSKSNSLFFESDAEAIKALEAEGKRLKYIAIKIWRQYLGSYKPKMYVRTRRSQNSIRLGKVKKDGANGYSLELTFDNGLVYHDSVFGKDQPQGHAIMLISTGWNVSRGWHKSIPNFGYKGGFNYLAKVEQAFNKGKNKKIQLEIQWSGAKTR